MSTSQSRFIVAVVAAAAVLLMVHQLCMQQVRVANSILTVQRTPDATQVAERLKQLQDVLRGFLETAHDPLTDKILARWDGNISERSPMVGGQVAYTMHKRSVSMCVRTPHQSRQLVDWNTGVFVALHELAHVGTDERGHTPLFNQNNTKLILLAEKAGILRMQHYDQNPITFCGMKIAYNPASCYHRGSCGSPWSMI